MTLIDPCDKFPFDPRQCLAFDSCVYIFHYNDDTPTDVVVVMGLPCDDTLTQRLPRKMPSVSWSL